MHYGAFKATWRQLGGTVAGQVGTSRGAGDGRDPSWCIIPNPLSDIIRLINKFSNNVMTRQLLLTLGAELEEPPGTVPRKGIRANRRLSHRPRTGCADAEHG